MRPFVSLVTQLVLPPGRRRRPPGISGDHTGGQAHSRSHQCTASGHLLVLPGRSRPRKPGMSRSMCLVHRCLCAVLIVVHLGCTSWQVHAEPVAQVLAERSRGKVRAYLADSARVILTAPRIEGDSLVGDVPGAERRGQFVTKERRAIPTDSVVRVETSRGDVVTTTLAVLGSVVLVGGVVFAIWYANCVSAGDCS